MNAQAVACQHGANQANCCISLYTETRNDSSCIFLFTGAPVLSHHRVLPPDMPMQIIGVLVCELPCCSACNFKALMEILEPLRHATIIQHCISCGIASDCGVVFEEHVFIRRMQ